MQKRSIMIPLNDPKPKAPEPEQPQPKREIEEDKIFKPNKSDAPELDIKTVVSEKPERVQEEEEDLPQTPKQGRKHKQCSEERKAHLAKCRELSLEARRKKKLEREALMKRAHAIIEADEEKKKEEEILRKHRYLIERNEPERTDQEDKMRYPRPPPAREEEPGPPRSASVAIDTATQQINYDMLTEKIYSRFKADSQLQEDLRREERMKAQAEYEHTLRKFEEDQHKRYQRQMSLNLMAGKPNSVFRRSAMIQERIRNRFQK